MQTKIRIVICALVLLTLVLMIISSGTVANASFISNSSLTSLNTQVVRAKPVSKPCHLVRRLIVPEQGSGRREILECEQPNPLPFE